MSRITRFGRACALVVVPVVLVSCGGTGGPKPPNQKKTIPVHGEIYIDGQPGYGVNVDLTPKAGQDQSSPIAPHGEAGEDGTFKIMTYSTNDGAPAGEYVLTFTWTDRSKGVQIGGAKGGGEPPDQFDGKYADPAKSKHTLSVGADATEVDAGRIELTNK